MFRHYLKKQSAAGHHVGELLRLAGDHLCGRQLQQPRKTRVGEDLGTGVTLMRTMLRDAVQAG